MDEPRAALTEAQDGPLERLLFILVCGAVLAAIDLSVKQTLPTPEWAFHHRSHLWVALSLMVLMGACALARVPSRSVVIAAGLMCGGVLGNLLSARWNENLVPNPLVVGHEFGVAFNVADVAFLVGDLLVIATFACVTIRHRPRVKSPRRGPSRCRADG